jgi:hypothetical protein
MTTDLNTLDDWWNEGFDDFFDGASVRSKEEVEDNETRWAWVAGWLEAEAYSNAMKEQPDE